MVISSWAFQGNSSDNEPEVEECLICIGATDQFELTLKSGSNIVDPANAIVGQTYQIDVDMFAAPCNINPAYRIVSSFGVTVIGAEVDSSCGDATFNSGITITSPNWYVMVAPYTAAWAGPQYFCLDYGKELGTAGIEGDDF